jgi:uncharacterized Zn finger protein
MATARRSERPKRVVANNGKRPRFDVGALRELAGDKVFGRGEEYYHDGQVQILSIEPSRVLAQVAGSEDYRTTLTGRGKTIDGHCACPAFTDWGFCKHMVAVALAVNAAGDGESEGGGALSRIREHLKTKSVNDLAEVIVGLAERDLHLFRKLELAAAGTQADDATLEARLRKAIDGATRIGSYIDYSSAPGWADGVNEALDAIEQLASGSRAALALKLAERAIERIAGANESIDDSDGHCGALLNRARDIHLAAASVVRPEPMQLARNLFAREMHDDYEIFHNAVAVYADVLGEQGQAEYRRLAVAAWDKLPSRSGKVRAEHGDVGRYDLLKDVLDFFAERDGDVDARIALRAKDLSSPWSYLQLAEFCLSQGRKEEALRIAEEGLWLFEDGRPDERLLFFAVKLLCKASRKANAEAHLWRAFQKAPSHELYKQLIKLGGNAAAERAIAFLEARLAGTQRRAWNDGANLLINIFVHDKRFDAAWSAVKKFGADVYTQQELARASDQQHPSEALQVYAAQVEQFATGGIYDEAAKLIARMGKIRSTTEQAAYVADLKMRHGRKRNFMKLLG